MASRLTERIAPLLLIALVLCSVAVSGQSVATASAQLDHVATGETAPLPDVVALVGGVEANQRKAEAVEKNYIYHSILTQRQNGGDGKVKKTTITESDRFWIDGVPVQRTTSRDGRALTADELTKEDERIDKMAAKANLRRSKADEAGTETDARGEDEVPVSRLIQLGEFTNPRRVQLNGRNTIAVDFTGDPKAKTGSRAEEVIRDLSGTAWIDEHDHVLARVEGRFMNSYKIAFGLIADFHKDTTFSMVQVKVNDEVWLPQRFEGRGSFHALLFFGFTGSAEVVNSDFRKFRAKSTLLPATNAVTTEEQENGSRQDQVD